jgi:hypothetical protein
MAIRLPKGAGKAAVGTVAAAGVGVGIAAAAGALPGTEDAPQKITDFFNNATGGIFNFGTTALYAAAAVALILLLK